MKFLFPSFLFALLAVAIPIVIHLFSFKRYKTVYFSNVNYLKDIKKESKRKSRLKQLLILSARIGTLVFLVFAFAQPIVPKNENAQSHTQQLVAVYVDNSFSMNALSEQGQLLEVARNKALEICMAYPAGTKFRLFTNDLEPKHQHLYNKEQFIQEVSGIQASPTVIPLSLVYNRFDSQHDDFKDNADKILYFISDFQRSISDMDNFSKVPSIFSYYVPLVPNEVANLYIDSCWVEVPAHRLGLEENIFVRIKNSSNQNYQNLPLKLVLNDSVKSITSFSVNAQQEITASLKYNNNSSGSQLGRIEITDYPFTHDNNWYISYFVEKNIKALAVFDTDKESQEGLSYLSALFANDDYVVLDEMNVQNMQVNRLKEYNTIFLINLGNFTNGFLNELEKVVSQGTSVVLLPKMGSTPTSNNFFLRYFNAMNVIGIDSTIQELSVVDFDQSFYKNVFRKREENPVYPSTQGHLTFSSGTRSDENILLAFQNGDKALSQLDYQNGKVWVFAFSLNKKNEAFAHHVLFVPSLYNIVLNSLPKQDISFVVGKNNFITITGNRNIDRNSLPEITNTSDGETFIPKLTSTGTGTRIEFGEQINTDGHFLLKNNNETLASMAFNFNRLESDLRYLSAGELDNKLEVSQLNNGTVIQQAERNFAELFDELQNGKQLWKWCILFSLFFILCEVLIIRLWK